MNVVFTMGFLFSFKVGGLRIEVRRRRDDHITL
jgi:hypothetical protein